MITKERDVALGEAFGSRTLYHVKLKNRDGTALRARVTGRCKTWKRDEKRWRLPMKHGWRDCFYLSPANAGEWTENDPDAYRGRIVLLQKSLGFDPGTPFEIVHDKLIDVGREDEADELRELASGAL